MGQIDRAHNPQSGELVEQPVARGKSGTTFVADMTNGVYHPMSMSWTGRVSNPDCSGASDEHRQEVLSSRGLLAIHADVCGIEAGTPEWSIR